MTIDSINGQRPYVIDVTSSKKAVSTSQKQAFEQKLNNAVQPQFLVDQANLALVSGEPKAAARYLGEAAQQISDSEVTVSNASDYR